MVHTVSYAFRNDDTSIMTLDSIGWQIVSSEQYRCPSDDRPDPGHVVFNTPLMDRAIWILIIKRFLTEGTCAAR